VPLHARSPCLRDAMAVRSVVEAAGRERFAARAARFEGDLAAADADQVVWHGLAEALGYRRNTRPCGQLAEAVAWAEAQAAVREAAGERRPRVWPFAWASPWIGRGRAQVIAINVLLPFAAAAGLSEATELFERLPGEPTKRIIRYRAEQLGAPTIRFRGACQ